MATQDEDDDVDINPFTMLLLPPQSDDPEPHQNQTQPSLTLQPDSPDHHLQHHHIRSIQSTVLIRQIKSQGIPFQLWPAATSLLHLLDRSCQNPSSGPFAALHGRSRQNPSSGPLAGVHGGSRQLRILELGSGTGLVGIAAAAVLSADVTLTDLPHVLPNLRFNVGANAGMVAANGGKVEVAALGWGVAEEMEAVGRDFDLVLGSDVVYHEHLFEPLIETLGFVVAEEVVFFMGHLRRWKKEAAFFKKARKVFDVEVVHRDEAAEGARVGVVVYRFVRRGKGLNGVVR